MTNFISLMNETARTKCFLLKFTNKLSCKLGYCTFVFHGSASPNKVSSTVYCFTASQRSLMSNKILEVIIFKHKKFGHGTNEPPCSGFLYYASID